MTRFTSILAPILLASLASAENRVFGDLGSAPCQKCLAEVEATCKGPVISSQFNNCFCVPDSKAWSTLKSCITTTNTECNEYKDTILGSYGSHCFAYKKDENEAVCVDSSQNDELLLSLVDSFCSEFVTPSATASATTTASNNTASASTTAASTSAAQTDASSSSSSATTDGESTAATTDMTTPAPTGSGAASTTSSAPASTTSNPAASLSPLDFGRAGLLSLFVGVVGLLM